MALTGVLLQVQKVEKHTCQTTRAPHPIRAQAQLPGTEGKQHRLAQVFRRFIAQVLPNMVF